MRQSKPIVAASLVCCWLLALPSGARAAKFVETKARQALERSLSRRYPPGKLASGGWSIHFHDTEGTSARNFTALRHRPKAANARSILRGPDGYAHAVTGRISLERNGRYRAKVSSVSSESWGPFAGYPAWP